MKKVLILGILLVAIVGLVFAAPLDAKAPNKMASIKAKKDKVKRNYMLTKNQYIKAKNEYLRARQAFLKIKAKNKKVLETEEGREKAKNFLEKTIDRAIKRLEIIKTNIEDKNYPFKDDAITNIEGYVEQLETKRAEIDDLNSKEEIIEFTKDLRTLLRDTHKDSRIYAAKILAEKVDLTLNKFNEVIEKVDAKIQEKKEAGENTEELETKLEELNNLYSNAKTNLENAKNSFDEATSSETPFESLKKGHNYLREGHKELRKAYRVLREILLMLKGDTE